jgi:hypothetical protein
MKLNSSHYGYGSITCFILAITFAAFAAWKFITHSWVQCALLIALHVAFLACFYALVARFASESEIEAKETLKRMIKNHE